MLRIKKQVPWVVAFFLCLSVHSSPHQTPLKNPYEHQIAHFQDTGNMDSLTYYQGKLISHYQSKIAELCDSVRLQTVREEQERGVLLIEWGALVLLLTVAASAVVFYYYRKILRDKEQKAIHRLEFSTFLKHLVSQKNLLSLNENGQISLLHKHLQTDVDETQRAIEQIKRNMTDEEWEQVLIAQAQQLEKVKQYLHFAANDERPASEDWLQLHDQLQTVYECAIAFLDGKRKNMSEEDYRMCLLVLAGFLPKHMVRLLCCTPQKISMQRKRYLETFFCMSGRPADFDRQLRCL